MKALIEQTINWNKIGKHPKENYKYSIEKAVVSKETAVLSLDIRLNFIIPFSDVKRIRKQVINEIPELKDVTFHFIYENMVLSKEEIIKLYIPHMIHGVNGEYAGITKTIFPKEYTYDHGQLTIMALGDVAVRELNRRVADQFQVLLQRNFSLNVEVRFANHEDSYKETEKERISLAKKELEEARRLQEIAAANAAVAQGESNGAGNGYGNGNGNGNGKWPRRSQNEGPVVGNRILGKTINDEAISLSSLTEDSGVATIEGMLFKMDARTIKNNKKLVTLFITDKITSVCVKVFASEEKWAEMEQHLKSGDYVKIRGNAEYDTWENSVVLMGKDIEKIEKESRQDNADKKRIELHAHTKMSAMDGLNDVSSMIKTAAAWGHKAIALTDHGVVQSFPEAQKTVKYGKLDIKIIYGLEGYLVDDGDSKDGERDYKSKSTNHIILLAKNQEGLKNLYKLVSLSHLEYFYKRPRLPKSVLEKYREGLIIGSACEAGEVYRSILHNKTDEEIRTIVSFYDYLEIQPLVNNQFLIDNGSVKGLEELKDINRKVIAFGKEMGKPVVATCDAHYTDPEEAIYRKILMAGQGYKDIEGDQGLYLRTTEEMLEEFQYLGHDLAREVVIDAPNQIADLVEEVVPVPSGKFPPKIDGAEERLRKTCMENAWRIYGNPLPELVQKRLDKELDSIINNGYAVMYVSAEMLVSRLLPIAFRLMAFSKQFLSGHKYTPLPLDFPVGSIFTPSSPATNLISSLLGFDSMQPTHFRIGTFLAFIQAPPYSSSFPS